MNNKLPILTRGPNASLRVSGPSPPNLQVLPKLADFVCLKAILPSHLVAVTRATADAVQDDGNRLAHHHLACGVVLDEYLEWRLPSPLQSASRSSFAEFCQSITTWRSLHNLARCICSYIFLQVYDQSFHLNGRLKATKS